MYQYSRAKCCDVRSKHVYIEGRDVMARAIYAAVLSAVRVRTTFSFVHPRGQRHMMTRLNYLLLWYGCKYRFSIVSYNTSTENLKLCLLITYNLQQSLGHFGQPTVRNRSLGQQ